MAKPLSPDTRRVLDRMTPAQLNDWYEKTVGYRPQVDDPIMTDKALRELCAEYAAANAPARYRLRVEAHLLTLADDAARKQFLESELAKWIERFESFVAQIDAGTYRGEANAFDFHITMADLRLMRAKYDLAELVMS